MYSIRHIIMTYIMPVIIAITVMTMPVFAVVMDSTTYKMQSDSMNIGGIYSTSTSYHMEDTMGEIATGIGTSASYVLYAGYQQMHDSTISMTPGDDITLDALSMDQDTAVGTSAWTVTTDDAAGYALSVRTATSPALQDGATAEVFADYTEGVPGTPETWSVSGAYEFGFSARGTDVSTGVWGSDTDCVESANVPSGDLKWRGFNGTTDVEIATRGTRTPGSGLMTHLCVATEQEGVFAPSGTYTATITATAVAQ
jgi:hypothetical protein